jgi:hypothetical protein
MGRFLDHAAFVRCRDSTQRGRPTSNERRGKLVALRHASRNSKSDSVKLNVVRGESACARILPAFGAYHPVIPLVLYADARGRGSTSTCPDKHDDRCVTQACKVRPAPLDSRDPVRGQRMRAGNG